MVGRVRAWWEGWCEAPHLQLDGAKGEVVVVHSLEHDHGVGVAEDLLDVVPDLLQLLVVEVLLLAARLHDEVVGVHLAVGLDAALEHVHALAVDRVEDLVQHARVVRADDLNDEVAISVQLATDGLPALDGRGAHVDAERPLEEEGREDQRPDQRPSQRCVDVLGQHPPVADGHGARRVGDEEGELSARHHGHADEVLDGLHHAAPRHDARLARVASSITRASHRTVHRITYSLLVHCTVHGNGSSNSPGKPSACAQGPGSACAQGCQTRSCTAARARCR